MKPQTHASARKAAGALNLPPALVVGVVDAGVGVGVVGLDVSLGLDVDDEDEDEDEDDSVEVDESDEVVSLASGTVDELVVSVVEESVAVMVLVKPGPDDTGPVDPSRQSSRCCQPIANWSSHQSDRVSSSYMRNQ